MFSFLVTTVLSLLVLTPTLALPTSGLVPRTALHACSVYVQRWCAGCEEAFDATYYASAPSGYFAWNTSAFYSQTSLDVNIVSGELDPVQVGSNILHIYNTANPVVNDTVGGHSDPGKLSFTWGNESFDSFSSGSPCQVIPVGEGYKYGEATQYSCTFQCDK